MHDPRFGPGEARGFPGPFYTVPAFVNAHTHLELTFQKGVARPQPESFAVWVDELVAAARDATEETYKASYRDGLAQCLAHGTAAVLDHCRRAAVLLPESGSFPGLLATALEFSGFEEARVEEYWQRVADVLALHPGRIRALSPVAPHSISGALYRRVVSFVRERGWLLCGHLAETREERAFLLHGTGPFARYMERWAPRDMSGFAPPGCSPVAWMDRLGVLGPRTVAAHCNDLDDRDVELLARSGTHVVHCPGSARFFGHETFRLEDLLAAGVNVALGTDSLASTDTLSILAELRRLRAGHPGLPRETIFAMGTDNGRRAIHGGTLPDPLPDDVCVLPWSGEQAPPRVTVEAMLEDLLEGTREPVALLVGGRTVWKAM